MFSNHLLAVRFCQGAPLCTAHASRRVRCATGLYLLGGHHTATRSYTLYTTNPYLMPPKKYDGWYLFENIKDFPDGIYQYDYYVWKIKTKVRESAGVDTRLSNE